MVSFDPNYEGVIQYCESCGRKMSSFEIGLEHALCSDCRGYHQDEMDAEIKRLESLGPATREEADEEIRNLLENRAEEESGCCPRCGEDPCVCGIEEHPDSYYSDPPDEHEYHDDFDYDDYDSPRGRLYPDPDDEEIFF